jgi:hypothetical protein
VCDPSVFILVIVLLMLTYTCLDLHPPPNLPPLSFSLIYLAPPLRHRLQSWRCRLTVPHHCQLTIGPPLPPSKVSISAGASATITLTILTQRRLPPPCHTASLHHRCRSNPQFESPLQIQWGRESRHRSNTSPLWLNQMKYKPMPTGFASRSNRTSSKVCSFFL